LKQTEPNPEMVRINHPVGSQITGKVKSITDFGALTRRRRGIDGPVHTRPVPTKKTALRGLQEGRRRGGRSPAIDVENERIRSA
jgi:small subunit ribosomal protein S1